MKWLKALLIIPFLITALFLYNPASTYACSCLVGPPVEVEFERVSAVFSGKVVSIKQTKNVIVSSIDPVEITLEVKESWKGVNSQKVIVYTARDSASCGFNFEANKEYLVYATKDDNGKLHVSLCSLTKDLSLADEDLSYLGEGKVPTEEDLNNKSEQPAAYHWIIASVIGVFGLVSIFVLRKKFR